MPLSTNAQNDEKGFSMVLRDIEHLYLLLKQANISTDGLISGNSVGEGAGQGTTSQYGDNAGNAEGEVAVGAMGPRGPRGLRGVSGTTPLGPSGEVMTIQTINACVDGVDQTMYIYGYVVP